MQHILTLPELCGKHDHGGGVACGDDFIVFTKAQISDRYLTQTGSPELQEELTEAALAVELVISFYMTRSDLGEQGLRSLPTPQSRSPFEIEQKPWFFLNAAKVDPRGIGIVGRGNLSDGTLVETLLAVLSRPWCVLELCYSTTSAIDALLAFAILACQLDLAAYTPARILLSHERSHRLFSGLAVKGSAGVESLTLPKPTRQRKANIEHIRELCAALFIISENSYSGFWMRAICVSALRLDLSISLFGSSLIDPTGTDTEVMRSENLLHRAIERQFDDKLTSDKNHQVPAFEERLKAEALKASFSSLSTVFSVKTLPQLYGSILHEITDLTV